MKWSYDRLAVTVILFAALLRFIVAGISRISGDGCLHALGARFIAVNGELPLWQSWGDGDRFLFWSPPLYHVISAAMYKISSIFGIAAAEFSLKMLSPIAGALTLPFVYLIARDLFDRRIAFFATLAMSFVPIHFYYSTLAFVDALVTLFIVACAYLILKKKLIVAAFIFGLALLTKVTALFSLPFLLYLLYNSNKNLNVTIKKAALFTIVGLIVGSAAYIRNWINFGNPIWPFLFSILGGSIHPPEGETTVSLLYLLNPDHLLQLYLSLFGVPLGNVQLLLDAPIPFLILAAWLAITILAFSPVFIGAHRLGWKSSQARILWVWIAIHIAGIMVYVININTAYLRHGLPMIPALAIIWALGFDKIVSIKKIRYAVLIVFVGLATMFVSTEFAKPIIAAPMWNVYEEDFRWVKENTPPDAFFYYRGQCLSFNTGRESGELYGRKEAYLWVNPYYPVESTAQLDEKILGEYTETELLYSNEVTGTKVYQANK